VGDGVRLPPANTLPCVRCGRRGSNRHEKLPRSRGGLRDDFNTVVLCGSGTTGCHGWVTANPDAAEKEGLYVRGQMIRGVYHGPDGTYRNHYRSAA
jgi:hypothetical protein